METKNREKLLMIGTATVAGLWLLNLVVFSPLIASWHSRSDEIADLRKKIANGAMVIRRQFNIQDRWDNMRANALPNNTTLAERQLFTAFDKWVSTGRVTEGSFRPQVQEPDTNFTTVDCRSDVSGSIQSISDFLKAMSKDPLANKVESFELTAKDDNGRQLVLGLSLSGLILNDSDPSSIQLAPAAPTPVANTNLAANEETDLFRMIRDNNIFDQGRFPRSGNTRPPAPKMDTITFNGTSFDNGSGVAFFSGSGVDAVRPYKVGDTLYGDLKIARINNIDTVELTNSSSNTFTLSTDGYPTIRREDNGPWRASSYVAAATTTETNSTESASPAPTTGTGANDILAILKKRREEAEK
jgi:hypothetical protein